jgi:hypothetical protein
LLLPLSGAQTFLRDAFQVQVCLFFLYSA